MSKKHVHVVYVVTPLGAVDERYDPCVCDSEDEALEVARDFVYECALVNVLESCIVVALPEWEVVGEVRCRRAVSWS